MGDDQGINWLEAGFWIVVAIIFFAMLPHWLGGTEERAVLSAAGYSDIKLTGFSFFDCPDLFGMGFSGKGPTGKPAKGTVCRGILTQSTIRLGDRPLGELDECTILVWGWCGVAPTSGVQPLTFPPRRQ